MRGVLVDWRWIFTRVIPYRHIMVHHSGLYPQLITTHGLSRSLYSCVLSRPLSPSNIGSQLQHSTFFRMYSEPRWQIPTAALLVPSWNVRPACSHELDWPGLFNFCQPTDAQVGCRRRDIRFVSQTPLFYATLRSGFRFSASVAGHKHSLVCAQVRWSISRRNNWP